jgi:hypothetical protein
MKNTEARAISSFFVWTAFTIVGVAAIVNGSNMSTFTSIVLAVILAGSAVTATQSIWKSQDADDGNSAEKNKRRNNVDRILERLSDREIEDLRARLMADGDGEAVSLDDLLQRRN